jgi:hypothetical protein
VTTALAAYEIAAAGSQEAALIADEVAARAIYRLAAIGNSAARAIASPGQPTEDLDAIAARTRRDLAHALRRDRAAVASVAALVPGTPPSIVTETLATLDTELARQAHRVAERVATARDAAEIGNGVPG